RVKEAPLNPRSSPRRSDARRRLASARPSAKKPAMQIKSRAALLLALSVSLVPLSACGTLGRNRRGADTRYVARDVNTLYNAAWDRMRQRNYAQAALIFDEVERQH